MMITRRTAFAAALAPVPALAQQDFPNRPLRILTAFAAGGGTDLIARAMAHAMTPVLGQQVLVENRPGAGGNLATEVAAQAPADGYTILMGNHGPMSVNPTLFRNLRVDPERALTPLGLVADAPLVVVVGPRSRAQTMRELLDEVRAEVTVLQPPEWNRFQHSFSHIFGGGYAAGYYSYKWAEVLSADCFAAFEEQGVLEPAVGRRFLAEILSVGGSRPAIDSFRAFRGRDPSIDALLRHNGMTEDSVRESSHEAIAPA
jgi:hypothetical protein